MEHHIPFEIITEIMSYLPVKSLLRFKCVSRQLYSLIHRDHDFIEKHRERAPAETLNVETTIHEDASRTFRILPGKYTLCESYRWTFHGLMIVKDLASQSYYIRNHATRQTLRLVDPHEGTCKFFLASSFKSLLNGDCKLISFYKNTSMGVTESGFQILTVNKDKHWRPLKLRDDYASDHHRGETLLMRRKSFILIDIGSTNTTIFLWMIIYKDIGQNLCLKVLSFNIMNEHFTTMTLTSLPQGFFSDLLKVYLMSWNECLAVAEVRNEALNVLVLEQDNKEKKLSCKSKMVVPLRFSQGDMISMRDNLIPLTAISHLLIFMKGNEYFWYDMKSEGSISTINMNDIIFTFTPSLVTLEGMISENQNNNEGT